MPKILLKTTPIYFALAAAMQWAFAGRAEAVPPASLSACEGILDMLALKTQANYEKLKSWRGIYECRDESRITADALKSMLQILRHVRAGDGTVPSGAASEVTTGTISFAVDCTGSRLWTYYSPAGPPKLRVDGSNEDIALSSIAPAKISILAPDSFISFEPNRWNVNQPELQPMLGVSSRQATRESIEKAATLRAADVFDPRFLYFRGGDLISKQLRIMKTLYCDSVLRVIRGHSFSIDETYIGDGAVIKINVPFNYGASDVVEERLVFESAAGYNMTSAALIYSGNLTHEVTTLKYLMVDDVYVPVSYDTETFNRDGSRHTHRHLESIRQEVNRPLDSDQFLPSKLGLSDGDCLVDKLEAKMYVMRLGELRPINAAAYDATVAKSPSSSASLPNVSPEVTLARAVGTSDAISNVWRNVAFLIVAAAVSVLYFFKRRHRRKGKKHYG